MKFSLQIAFLLKNDEGVILAHFSIYEPRLKPFAKLVSIGCSSYSGMVCYCNFEFA